jgi:hypothetical protein
LIAACCADSTAWAAALCAKTFECGHLTAVTLNNPTGLGGQSCYYDRSSGQLATIKLCSDTPAFCDNTSFCQDVGEEIPPCTGASPNFKHQACR